MKKINFLIIAMAVLLLQSCLKGRDMVLDSSKVPSIVEFGNVTTPSSAASAPYRVYVPQTLDPEVAEISINGIVNYLGPDPAPTDVAISLGVDPAAVTTYNTSQKANFTQLPATAYEMPTTVTIKKGERSATFPIKLKVAQFDKAKENVMALKITSVSTGVGISGNFGTIIYNLPVKSIWEGTYNYTIHNDYGTIDANIGGTFSEVVQLSTIGPNKLYLQYLWRTYSGYTHYQFNGDNTSISSITAFSGSERPVVIDKVVVVDAAKRIFEVNWTAIGRGVRERFERIGD